MDYSEYHRLKSPQEVLEWVNSHYRPEQLAPFDMNQHLQEICPLNFYKGAGAEHINKSLRAGVLSDDVTHFEDLQANLMEQALPESVIVYRFVSIKERNTLYWNTAFKKSYTIPSFLSTTLLRDAYSMDDIKRHRVPITLYAPKNAHGVFLPEVNPYSPEFEILFAHHTTVKRINGWTYQIVI